MTKTENLIRQIKSWAGNVVESDLNNLTFVDLHDVELTYSTETTQFYDATGLVADVAVETIVSGWWGTVEKPLVPTKPVPEPETKTSEPETKTLGLDVKVPELTLEENVKKTK